MATVRIDQQILAKLLTQQFQTISGSGYVLLYPSDAFPQEFDDDSKVIIHWEGLSLEQGPGGRREDEPDEVAFTMLISVIAPEGATRADGWALDGACSLLAEKMMAFRADTGDAEHYFTGLSWTREDDTSRENGRVRSCAFAVSGACHRQSGSSLS